MKEMFIFRILFNVLKRMKYIQKIVRICETDLNSYVTVNQIESDIYVELLLIFIKDKSVCFYFFMKISLLSILVT